MIYRFKATFDSSKGFMRQYELRGKNTLYDFHEHIVNDLDFAPDQMVLFRIEETNRSVQKEYGLFNTGDGAMDEVTVEQLIARKEMGWLYVFDVRFNRFLQITFMETDEELSRKSYPRTSDGKGDGPPQFNGLAKDGDLPLDNAEEDDDEMEESDIDESFDE